MWGSQPRHWKGVWLEFDVYGGLSLGYRCAVQHRSYWSIYKSTDQWAEKYQEIAGQYSLHKFS